MVAHRYRIFDKERCRLLYKVQCEVHVLPPVDQTTNAICHYCEKTGEAKPRLATLYCINDSALFCDICDRDFHEGPGKSILN